jgi:polysaccharide deacetylase 2 family uncharacterized protein YibQ
MSVDDLQQPLGTARGKPPPAGGSRLTQLGKRLGRFPLLPVVTGAGALVLAAMVGWALLVDDPLGGEPSARVRIAGRTADTAATTTPPDAPPASAAGTALVAAPGDPVAQPSVATGAPSGAIASPPAETAAVNVIDGRSGKASEVVVADRGSAGLAAAPDPRLIEKTRHGNVPRIGNDGARPADVYARPTAALPPAKATLPRIAIVVGGLGISANGTSEAITKLPQEITLAFAPYGTDLERVTARARTSGHEVLLQVPMEPFDYPDNDPGPQTLLTTMTGDQNVDRLHWFLARFPGFIGIATYMGARFTSSETALLPVMREVTKRGLMYLDDGSSQRSVTREIAGGLGTSFARADLVLDAVASPVEIDNALMRLEKLATEHGSALGFASALPVSVDRIARWAREAENRGYTLVPLSAVAARSKKPV